VALLKKLLTDYGIEPGRFRLEWVSASEGERFAEVVNRITEDVRKLGPSKFGRKRKKNEAVHVA
jgi:F420-non-reducing hydrogenase iron-sulfur subunit